MKPSLTSRPFGTLPDGRSVVAWIMTGAAGLTVELITYGGIVTSIFAPDHAGHFADVVLGFDSLGGYLADHPFFGAIIGRVAGRITNARFNLDGKRFSLDPNDAPNHCHGGREGFHRKLWSAAPVERDDGSPAVQLSYVSVDGEEGYPGEVRVAVTYSVTPDNSFRIDSEATTSVPTPLSLTHHSYFNLSGDALESIESHCLRVFADQFVVNNDRLAHQGRLESLLGRPNEFFQSRPLSLAIPDLFHNHGDLYLILRETPMTRAAEVFHPGTGRVVTVFTDEQYIQLYTGVSLDGSITGKNGKRYEKFAGLCLECEGYPDGANTPALGDIILRPGQTQRRTTSYQFTTKKPFQEEVV